MDNILLYLLIIPAVGGLLSIIFTKLKYVAEAISIISSLALIGLSIKLNLAGELMLKFGGISWGMFEFPFVLYSRTFNSFLVFFVALFTFLTVIYSCGFLSRMKSLGSYLGLILWAGGGTIGFLISADLFFILIFWEIVSMLLFLLASYGTKVGLVKALSKTFAMMGFADLAMFVGMFVSIVLIGNIYGTNLITELQVPLTEGAVALIPFILLAVSSLVKAAGFPFHTWLPELAPVAPTPVLAFLPSALDKFLGIYFLYIIATQVFIINATVQTVMMAIGAFTIVFAVMMALVQHNLKSLLAFHAISQAGYMILGIGTGNPIGIAGALFHMLNNSIYKTALFYGVGSVEKQTGTTDADKLGGLAGKMPLTFIFMVIASLSISGIPPFNGFVSKWMIYQSLVEINRPIFIVAAIFGSALTLASFVKVLYAMFLGQKRDEFANVKETGISMWGPGMLLAILCILLGVFAQYPLMKWFGPAAGMPEGFGFAQLINFQTAFWNPTTATVLLFIGLGLGLLIYIFTKGLKVRNMPTFTLGERLEQKTRFHASDFYHTIRNLGFLKGFYTDMESGFFDIYSITGRIGGSVVRGFKELHNGVLSNYISWCIIGLGIIFFLLIR